MCPCPPHHAKVGVTGTPKTACGSKEGASRRFFFGTAEQLAEKRPGGDKSIPQRLKPDKFRIRYGTAEAVPLQNAEFFRKL